MLHAVVKSDSVFSQQVMQTCYQVFCWTYTGRCMQHEWIGATRCCSLDWVTAAIVQTCLSSRRQLRRVSNMSLCISKVCWQGCLHLYLYLALGAGQLRLTVTGIAILISKEKNLMREMFSTWHVLPALGRSILPWFCLVTWATCCACPAGQSWPWPGTMSLSSECQGIRWTLQH